MKSLRIYALQFFQYFVAVKAILKMSRTLPNFKQPMKRPMNAIIIGTMARR